MDEASLPALVTHPSLRSVVLSRLLCKGTGMLPFAPLAAVATPADGVGEPPCSHLRLLELSLCVKLSGDAIVSLVSASPHLRCLRIGTSDTLTHAHVTALGPLLPSTYGLP